MYPDPYNQNAPPQQPWQGHGPGGVPPYAPQYPPPQKSNTGLVIGLIVGGIFLFMMLMGGIGAFVMMRAKSKATPTATTGPKAFWSDAASPIPVSSADPMRGERGALVTIVVFSDFQCPFCARLEPTLDSVRARYGHDVRIIWKDQPLAFHMNAKPAAEAARGVFELKGNEAFWNFHDRCFANQSSLSQASYETWASQEGVDASTFARGLSSHRWQYKVEEDAQLGTRVGAVGTPTTFVNGIKLAGAQPLSTFERTIDDELVKARREVAAGTPRDRIYVERSRVNYSAAAVPMPTTTVPSMPTVDQDANKIFPVPVGASPVRGPSTALVTVIEFADYQCPFCKRAEASMDRLREEYPVDVRIVFKQQPLAFHPQAEPAAELALEARAQRGDTGYWLAHDKLFAAQPSLDTTNLLEIARSMGLNEGKVSTAILAKKHRQTIEADAKMGNSFGAMGTPTFFINGRKLSGAQPYDKFKQVVDEELPKARAKLGSGTSRANLYDELVGLR